MKVIHWNDVSPNIEIGQSSGGGIKRYEDELFNNIKSLRPDIELSRIGKNDSYKLLKKAFSRFTRQTESVDIIHATYQAISLGVYMKVAKKFVVTVHDLIPIVYPQEFRSLLFKAGWKVIPSAIKKTDRIIAVSEFTKSEIIRLIGVEESKISVIYEGVDHTQYRQLDKTECKRRFGLNTTEKHILVVAGNAVHKRMDTTKQVLNIIRSKRKDVHLVKAGYGQSLNGEGIINVGYVPEKDMPKLFNAADIYLHTSEYEGFGLPILEAMACGIPVVASNKASIPEVVGPNGNMVNVEAPDAVDQFSEKILYGLDNGRDERMIEYSRKFSWQKNAGETIKLYEEISH
jgi:glycosyltransferase involved in cell wall biosynthesis